MHITPGIYTHYKGKEYEVLGIGYEEETMHKVVIYKALYPISELGGDNVLFTRPLENFCETVTVNGTIQLRFTPKES